MSRFDPEPARLFDPSARVVIYAFDGKVWHIAANTYPNSADTLCGHVRMAASPFVATNPSLFDDHVRNGCGPGYSTKLCPDCLARDHRGHR